MDESRTVVRQNRLQKYGRILSSRYRINIMLDEHLRGYGCTDSTSKIFIKTDIDNDSFKNLIYQKSMVLHEIGHVLFTKNKVWINRFDVSSQLSNIIEDGRVEEAISRMYPKARLYFVYANQNLLPLSDLNQNKGPHSISVNKKDLEDELLVWNLIFREAKKTTGIPQLLPSDHEKIKQRIGEENHKFFLQNTRNAVNAKTEEEACIFAKLIQDKINKLFIRQNISWDITKTGVISVHNCGSGAKKMPEQQPYDKERTEQILKQLLKQAGVLPEPDVEKGEEEGTPSDDSSTGSGEEESQTAKDIKETINETESMLEKLKKEVSKQENKEPIGKGASGNEGSNDYDSEEQSEETNILEDIEDTLQKESLADMKDESEIISSGAVGKDFSSYDKNLGDFPYWLNDVNVVATNSLEGMATTISHLFKTIAQTGDGWQRNQLRGKMEMHKLPLLLTKTEQPKIFKKKDKKEQTELSAIILLDGSGSMKSRSYKATQATYTLSRALERGKFKSEVMSFHGNDKDTCMTGLKSFNQKLDFCKHQFKPLSSGGTPLNTALKGAYKSLEKQVSKRKIILVVTDGRPDSPNSTKKTIREIESKNIFVIGILIETRDYDNLFTRKLVCNEVDELPSKMVKVIKEVLVTVKRG